MFKNIKKWYGMNLWSAAMVRQAVEKGILTEEQYQSITGSVQ